MDKNASGFIGLRQAVRSAAVARTGLLVSIVCLFGVLLVGGNVGCGYALAGRGSFLPDYVKTIGVPTFTNRTNVFNLETSLTQKVRAEFIGRGKYRILPDSTDVDVAAGRRCPVRLADAGQLCRQPIWSRGTRSPSRRTSSCASLRDNKTLWESSSLIFRQEYQPQTGGNPQDVSAFFGQDANALERMSSDFARTIVSSILEAF